MPELPVFGIIFSFIVGWFDQQRVAFSLMGLFLVTVLDLNSADLMVADKDGIAEPRETPEAKLEYFELTDSSGEWHPAKAKIDGEKVVVTSDNVTSPIAVRYAYAVNPTNCNLYNRDGVPASPFCSRPEMLSHDPKLPQ